MIQNMMIYPASAEMTTEMSLLLLLIYRKNEILCFHRKIMSINILFLFWSNS